MTQNTTQSRKRKAKDVANPEVVTQYVRKDFMDQILEKYNRRESNTFIAYFNTTDFVDNTNKPIEFMERLFHNIFYEKLFSAYGYIKENGTERPTSRQEYFEKIRKDMQDQGREIPDSEIKKMIDQEQDESIMGFINISRGIYFHDNEPKLIRKVRHAKRSKSEVLLNSEEKRALKHKETFIALNKDDSEDDTEQNEFTKAMQNAGARSVDALGSITKNKTNILEMMENCINQVQGIFIIDKAESICPNGNWSSLNDSDRQNIVRLSNIAESDVLLENKSIVILLTEDLTSIHPMIRERWTAVEIPLPDLPAREEFLKFHKEKRDLKFKEPVQTIADLSAGLSKKELEDAIINSYHRFGCVTVDAILEKKAEIFETKYKGIIEMKKIEWGFERVGGLEYIKNYLRKFVIEPMLNRMYQFVPQGILFTGNAGTGKSIIAEGVAGECKINFIEFRPHLIFSKYVGESERNMDQTLSLLRTMYPCVLYIDEFDQNLSQRGESGDSGVSNRVFRQLMMFMSDDSLKGKVIIIACTNRPDLIDPALMRAGRLSKRIPVITPDSSAREQIFEVIMQKQLKFNPDDTVDFKVLADDKHSDGYTGAEIKLVLEKAGEIAQSNTLSQEHILSALERIRSDAKSTRTKSMEMLAIYYCNDSDFVPEKYKDIWKQMKEGKTSELEQNVDKLNKIYDKSKGSKDRFKPVFDV